MNNFKIIIIITILVIIIAALTSFTFMNFLNKDIKIRGKSDIGPTYELGNFTVNLAGSGGYKYIKANIVAELSEENLKKELDKRKPQIRDKIISILRSQEINDIETPGAGKIKNAIKEQINSFINKGKITDIWFTQLVVQ